MPVQDKSKRRRPRWSVRTLVIMVTLGCVYLACWEATRRHGAAARINVAEGMWIPFPDDPSESIRVVSDAGSPAPFVIYLDEYQIRGTGLYMAAPQRRYYVWFFGYVTKLPFDRHLPKQNTDQMTLVPTSPDFGPETSDE